MFAAHPATPVLGVGSGIAYSPVITAPVTTILSLPATPDTMFTPSDVATTTLITSGVVAGGTGLTATPPNLPNQPSALDLFNTTVTGNDLLQCDSLGECAMAALGLVPGEALLGTVGHHATSPGMSLPDFTLSCTHSFPGETQVLMADGTTKAIKDVKVGDRVTNAQPDGRTEVHRVDEIHVTSTDTEFTDLTITTPQGERTITSTQNHPYWDATTHQFVTAANLRPGHELQTNGDTATVGAVRNYTTTTVTYDLTVNGVHTYYVLAGTTPILVHNCGGEAIVHLDREAGHASITILDGGDILHSEQAGEPGTRAVAQVFDGELSNFRLDIHIPLPNPGLARAYQDVTLGQDLGAYDELTRSCITYCAEVLKMGGVEGIPIEEGSFEITKWLIRQHG